jgi:hypothetical protein
LKKSQKKSPLIVEFFTCLHRLFWTIFKRKSFGKKYHSLQTFTYYVTAPPTRSTGYREKEFDSLFYQFINQGYDIIEIKTIPHAGQKQEGFWIVCLVGALNENSAHLNLEEFEIPQTEELYDLHVDQNNNQNDKKWDIVRD